MTNITNPTMNINNKQIANRLLEIASDLAGAINAGMDELDVYCTVESALSIETINQAYVELRKEAGNPVELKASKIRTDSNWLSIGMNRMNKIIDEVVAAITSKAGAV